MARSKRCNLPDLSHLARPGQAIPVRATPKARQDRVRSEDDMVRIWVTAAPENGKANQAIAALLAAAMGVAPSRLRLVRGATARDKVFVYDVSDPGGTSRI